MTFYIDDALTLETAKAFDAFLEAVLSEADKPENIELPIVIDIVVDSHGGEVRAADLIYHKVKQAGIDELNLIVIGQASSSAFDLVLLLSKLDNTNVYLGASCFFCIHKMDNPASTRSEEVTKFYRESQNDDLSFMLELFGDDLTPAQKKALKRGDDVFLSIAQAKKILNGKFIR